MLLAVRVPRGGEAKPILSDRAEIGPLVAFLRLERGGIGLVAIPTQRMEENGAGGPGSVRYLLGGSGLSSYRRFLHSLRSVEMTGLG